MSRAICIAGRYTLCVKKRARCRLFVQQNNTPGTQKDRQKSVNSMTEYLHILVWFLVCVYNWERISGVFIQVFFTATCVIVHIKSGRSCTPFILLFCCRKSYKQYSGISSSYSWALKVLLFTIRKRHVHCKNGMNPACYFRENECEYKQRNISGR